MRLCEFVTDSRDKNLDKYLYAWARYKRGDIPERAEFEHIERRVLAKFPDAELVYVKRRFVPRVVDGELAEPTEVWWEFIWIVFNKNISGNDEKTKKN